jgi:hypothetical protein
MPSDIRSFFAPKSGGTPKAAVASQETKKTPAVKAKEVKETVCTLRVGREEEGVRIED